jgi:hypothetical protein
MFFFLTTRVRTQNFFGKSVFYNKKEYVKKKFQNIMVLGKNTKKIIFRKTGLPPKPEYPENR